MYIKHRRKVTAEQRFADQNYKHPMWDTKPLKHFSFKFPTGMLFMEKYISLSDFQREMQHVLFEKCTNSSIQISF